MTFEDAGREVTQNFSTMYSNLTLSSGLLAALLAVLGAGQLFNSTTTTPSHTTRGGVPAFSPVAVLILVLALPLLVRFLVRSMLGYNNLLRYNKIRAAAWGYLGGQSSWEEFASTYQVYELRWKSPETVTRLVWSNLKYGFLWLFVVFAAALGWGFYSTTGGWHFRLIAALIVGAGLGWEIWSLVNSRGGYFTRPTEADWEVARREARSLRGGPGDASHSNDVRGVEVLKDSWGVFVGRHVRKRSRSSG